MKPHGLILLWLGVTILVALSACATPAALATQALGAGEVTPGTGAN